MRENKTISNFKLLIVLPFLMISNIHLFAFQIANETALPNIVIDIKDELLRHELVLEGQSELILKGLKKGETYNLYYNKLNGDISILSINNIPIIDKATAGQVKFLANFDNSIKIAQASKGHLMISVVKSKTPIDEQKSMAVLSVNTGPSPTFLVEDVFIGGDCFDVSGVTYSGANSARGTFANGLTNIGFDTGVMLASGNISNGIGPNNTSSAGNNVGYSGDGDLTQLSGGTPTYDAAILEFDFEPTTDTLRFKYVFASEEYCDYSNSNFNDVFGFFLSGPGINGPYSNNSINIATLPTGQNVSINNVNHINNPAYYISNTTPGTNTGSNCNGNPLGTAPAINEVQYDGFTVILEATAIVQPCQTYHIKLAVADGFDGIYDSAVFLESNSFLGGEQVSGAGVNPVTGGTSAYEGCQGSYFEFCRLPGSDSSLDLVVNFNVDASSTATPGADYVPLPTFVTIPAGLDCVTLPIDIVNDGISEGTETITITLDEACSCTMNMIDFEIEDAIPISFDVPDEEICGGSSVTLTANPSGGIPDYTYLWDTGATTPSITVNPSSTQTYNVTVTDDCGNTMVDDATVSILTPPDAALSGAGSLCAEGALNPIDLTINFTGTGPWEFVYSIDGVDQTAIVTSSNPYILTVDEISTYSLSTISLEGGLCPGNATGSVNIGETIISPSLTGTDPSCNGDADGTVSVSVSGGQTPYSFNWSDPSLSGNLAVDLPAGSYTVTVTDADGCEGESSVDISEPPLLEATVSAPTDIDCNNTNGSASVSASGGTPSYTYIWDNGAGSGSSISVSTPGTYNVTVSDVNGCEDISFVDIGIDTISPLAVAAVTGLIDCNNEELTISGSGSSSGSDFSYLWTTTGGNIVSGQTTLNPVVDEGGVYILTVSNDVNGCTETTNVVVQEDLQEPTVNAGPAMELTCIIDQVFLNGAGSDIGPNYTMVWTTTNGNIVSGENTIAPLVDEPGTYTLTINNTVNGCSDSDLVIVTLDDTEPTVIPGPQGVINCANAIIELDATSSSAGPGFAYYWSTNDGNIVSGDFTLSPEVDQAGTYTLTITNLDNGCVADNEVDVIEDYSYPTALIADPDSINCTTPIILLNGNGSSSGSNYSYQWSTPNGNITFGSTSLQPNVNLGGTYYLEVTNDISECKDTAVVEVVFDQVYPNADAGMFQVLNCLISEASLSGQGSSGSNITYEWTTLNGNIVSGGDGLNPLVDEPGVYNLEVSNTQNGCVSEDNVIVGGDFDAPEIGLSGGGQITCTVLEVEIDGDVNGNPSSFVFEWDYEGNGNITSGQGTPSIMVNQSDVYYLQVTDPSNGCVSFDSLEVTRDENVPVAVANVDDILDCNTSSLSLDGAGTTQGADIVINWSTQDGNIDTGSTSLNPVVNAPGTYTLTVVDNANGCETDASVVVEIDTISPLPDLGADLELNCFNPSLIIEGVIEDPLSLYTSSWSVSQGGEVDSLISDLSILIDQPGVYSLYVQNLLNGCDAVSSTVVAQDFNQPTVDIAPGELLTCTNLSTILVPDFTTFNAEFSAVWSAAGQSPIEIDSVQGYEVQVTEADIYSLTVTDLSNGCLSDATMQVDQDVAYPTANAAVDDFLSCTTLSVSLDASGSSSGSSMAYSWIYESEELSTTQSLAPISVGDAGAYTFVVHDQSNDCRDSVTVNVQIDTLHPTLILADGEQLNCAVLTSDLNTVVTDSNYVYSYNWTSTNGSIVSSTDQAQLSVDAPGDYVVQVVNNINGCVSEAMASVTQDITIPDLQIETPELLTCTNIQTVLDATASSTGMNFEYNWQTATGNIVEGVNTLQPTIDAPGVYELDILNGSNFCSINASILVVEDVILPDAVINPADVLNCYDPMISLDGNGSSLGGIYEYQWSTNQGIIESGDNTLFPIISQEGTYNLLVSNIDNGCVNFASIEVQRDTISPVAAIASPEILNCAVLQIPLDASSSIGGSLAYSWATQDGNIIGNDDIQTITANSPGEYQLALLDVENGCVDTILVNVEQDIVAPAIQIEQAAIINCYDPEINLSSSVNSNSGQYSLLWSTSNGNILSGGESLNPEVNLGGLYVLNVLDPVNGCSNTEEIEVELDQEYPDLLDGIPGLIDCDTEEVNLEVEVSNWTSDYTLEWSTSNGVIISGLTTLNPLVTTAGQYTLVVTDGLNGCESMVTLTVEEDYEYPTVDAGVDFLLPCYEETYFLNAFYQSGGAPISVEWYTVDGNLVSGADVLQAEIDEGGTYQVTITNQINGCASSDEVLVDEDFPQGLIVDENPALCHNGLGSLFISGVQGGTAPYIYSLDGGQSFSGENNYPSIQPGDYTILAQDANGCLTDSESVTIYNPPPVNVDVEAQVDLLQGESYQLQAFINYPINQIASVSWTPPQGLSCYDCLEPVASPEETIIYQVEVVNTNGCRERDFVSILVDKDAEVYIPNAFSPDGDGDNEVFMIFADMRNILQVKKFMVFDRWGEAVFEYQNFLPNNPAYGWDGTFAGKQFDSGVFVYYAEIEMLDGRIEFYEGDVTIIIK